MGGTLSRLDAARLSQAAYIPVDHYRQNLPDAQAAIAQLPANWKVISNYSNFGSTNGVVNGPIDANNQFVVFVNDTTKQIVFSFKGSNNLSNFSSDIGI